MSLGFLDQLSVLACATGLALTAIWAVGLLAGADTPDWLPPMIGGISGFELFMAMRERACRRGDGHG